MQASHGGTSEDRCVLPPDLALALLINRTTQAYTSHAPAYIVYRERTHAFAPALGRSQEIDRRVVARNIDDQAVMNDLPSGGRSIGQAFPIIPYFDPFSGYQFSYYANLKRIDITLNREAPWQVATPAPNPGVDVLIPYFSEFDVSYAPDSQPDHLHFLIGPTPKNGAHIYWSEIVEDPQSGLPSHVVLRDPSSDMTISLDYAIVDGYWVVTHGTFTQTEHPLWMSFVINADVTYDQFQFPTLPPPELAALPPPTPSPTPSP